MIAAQYDQTILNEVARRLTELQRRILQALKDKGPGLPLEVAVRVLKFPEDVVGPLRELQAAGLVTAQTVSGQFGGELFSLTNLAEQVLRVVNDPTFQTPQAPAVTATAAATDPRQQEADLLNKLGELSREKGDLDKAVEYFQQALSITRDLATGGGTK